MANFAIINNKNKVIHVIGVANEIIGDTYPESEEKGLEYLNSINIKSIYPDVEIIKQTSFNDKFRGKYAGVTDDWVPDLDIFRSAQPYPSWVLNSEGTQWVAPKPLPEGKNVNWNEEKQDWEII